MGSLGAAGQEADDGPVTRMAQVPIRKNEARNFVPEGLSTNMVL